VHFQKEVQQGAQGGSCQAYARWWGAGILR